MKYRVHMIHSVSTNVDVEAESVEDAIDEALCQAPSPTNVSNHGVDPAGDWEECAVYDEGGTEVWSKAK